MIFFGVEKIFEKRNRKRGLIFNGETSIFATVICCFAVAMDGGGGRHVIYLSLLFICSLLLLVSSRHDSPPAIVAFRHLGHSHSLRALSLSFSLTLLYWRVKSFAVFWIIFVPFSGEEIVCFCLDKILFDFSWTNFFFWRKLCLFFP